MVSHINTSHNRLPLESGNNILLLPCQNKEGEYSPLLKRIIDICRNPQNKNALICNHEEKEMLASFVTNIFVRNPWSLRQIYIARHESTLLCITQFIYCWKTACNKWLSIRNQKSIVHL